MTDELLTVDELAKILKMRPRQVRELCRTRTQLRHGDKRLPFVRVHHKAIRFRLSDITRWIGGLRQC